MGSIPAETHPRLCEAASEAQPILPAISFDHMDTKMLEVTGCSRNRNVAFMAGALDPSLLPSLKNAALNVLLGDRFLCLILAQMHASG
jgi:hypothetical protein